MRPALSLGLEQNVAGIEIAQPHAPWMRGFRQNDAAAVIEIELKASGALLRRHLGWRRIVALGGRRC